MEIISQRLLTFLLNVCWQIALITAVAALCAWLLRGTTARYRHLLWVAALAISFCLPILTGAHLLDSAFFTDHSRLQPTAKPVLVTPIGLPEISPSNTPTLPNNPNLFIQINRNIAAGLVMLYLLFLLYSGVKLFRAWRRTRVIIRTAYPLELLEGVQTIIEKCQTAIGVSRVRILGSTAVPVPITVGILKPLIILPEPLLREADADVLMSAIGHELVHILRRDYLLNLIYELIYLPLSFHPAAALVRRRIKQTRELGCDEVVTESLLEANVYARALVKLAGSAVPLSRPAATITVGISDADILEVRIMTLLRRPKLDVRRKKLLLIAAALLLIVPCVAAASFAFRFEFDLQEFSVSPQQDATQEAKEKEERAQDERKRAKQEKEERERAEREGKTGFQGQEVEKQIRERVEREIKAKRQAELAKLAKITMAQAIQIATNQQPGTVLMCTLRGERDVVFYQVMIINGESTENTAFHVFVNAIDGQIIKTEKEER